MNTAMGPALTDALKTTSRSFWLSLRFLPSYTREPIALAYALARLADTIADTDCVDEQERARLLEAFQHRLVDKNSEDIFELGQLLHDHKLSEGEKKLLLLVRTAFAALERLAPADAELTRGVLKTLTDGMLFDGRMFAPSAQKIGSLQTMEQLDDYCYMVAGCVGGYWTDIHELHLPSMAGKGAVLRAEGIRLGKGLQMINILRDLPADLKNGRCYIPAQKLSEIGLGPVDLLRPGIEDKLRPLLHELMSVCKEHLEAGREYVRRLPWREFRLRLSSTWPLEIAFQTLDAMRRNPHPLNTRHKVKIPRKAVYRIMLSSTLLSPLPASTKA